MSNITSANKYVAVTPHDSTNILGFSRIRGLYIGVSGNVVVVDSSGNAVTFSNVPVGILPVECVRVNATSTTATNIVALGDV